MFDELRYSQYCSNYNEAMRILAECKKQTKFKKFLDDLKKKSHDIEHRGIEDYLIRPVQRIPVRIPSRFTFSVLI